MPEPTALIIGPAEQAVRVQLRRSPRRRTLGLQVRGGVATAHAPAGMPLERIVSFLESKHGWLKKHLQAQQAEQHEQQQASSGLRLGGTVWFVGHELTLQADTRNKTPWRDGPTLWLPPHDWQAQLKAWTQQAAQPIYAALVLEYARKLGAETRLQSVRVSDTRSRWGSCTAAGDIRLHWALTRAPVRVLHYVALHEAAHLLELNHSPRYWAHVARIMPQHAQARAWLRERGHLLLEGIPGEHSNA